MHLKESWVTKQQPKTTRCSDELRGYPNSEEKKSCTKGRENWNTYDTERYAWKNELE